MNGVVKPFPPTSALARARARDTAQLVQVRALAERGAAEAQAMVKQRRLRILRSKRMLIACAVVCSAAGFAGGVWFAAAKLNIRHADTLSTSEQIVYQVMTPPQILPASAAISVTSSVATLTATTVASNEGVLGRTQTVASMPAGKPPTAPSATKPTTVAEPKPTPPVASAIATQSITTKIGATTASPTNVYEAVVRADSSEPVIKPVELRVIGIPVDGVLQLDVGGVVRQFKPGQMLPNGEVLTEANAASNKFKTNRSPQKSDQN